MRSDDAFWEDYRKTAEESFASDKRIGSLDVEARARQGTSLNTAEMLHHTAVKLVLTRQDDVAREAIRTMRELALRAAKSNEKGYYSDVIFARYMAMRIAATAEWMLDGSMRAQYLERMVEHLDENIRLETEKAKGDVREVPQVGGRLAMHYAQAGRWADIVTMPGLARGGGGSAPPWRGLFRSLSSVAVAKLRPDDERAFRKARKSLDEWFLEHTNVKRCGQPWDPGLSSNDIVSIAEIRARWTYGVNDPWKTVRSIRFPDLERGDR